MGPPGKKSPARKTTVKRIMSPAKKKKTGKPGFTGTRKEKSIITALGFMAPCVFEAYKFAPATDRDDGFTGGARGYFDGKFTEVSADLNAAGFVSYVFRRFSPEVDEPMKGFENEKIWRLYFIRYPPENESTAETRLEGMAALNRFFRDENFSKFPAKKDFEMCDATDEENFRPLDEHFLNSDIKKFLEEDVPEENLDENFYENFPCHVHYA